MNAPLVVNTLDGTCWTRREATRDGQPLYAMADCRRCPELVMATLAELAEHGIAGTADVLPVPAGPVAVRQPVEEVEAERDRLSRDLRGVFGTLDAVRGLLAESTPFLPGDGRDAIVRAVEWLAADRDARRRQVTELRERLTLVHRTPQDSITPAEVQLGQYRQRTKTWSTATYDTGTERALYEIACALRATLEETRDQRNAARLRVAELEAERHTTNEALSDSAEALREQQNRIAELERPAVERHRREVRESYQWLAAHAREDGDLEGEAVVLQQLAEREAVWKQEDELAKEFAADPLALKPWTPGPSAEESADRLARLLAPSQAACEDAEMPPLTVYRASHESIVMGLYATREAAREHCEADVRSEWPAGTSLTFAWIPDDSDPLSPEELSVFAGQNEESVTGYVVTPLEIASKYDEEADE